MQHIPAIITRDRHGTVIGWNDGAEALLGYAESEVLGRSAELLLGTAEGATTGTNGSVEISIRAKSGRWIAVVRTPTVVLDADGERVGTVEVFSALPSAPARTPKQRSAALTGIPVPRSEGPDSVVDPKLAADHRLLQRLVETAPGAFCSFRWSRDGHGTCPFASPKLEGLLGSPVAELVKDTRPMLERVHPDDLGRLLATLGESARTRAPWRCDYRYAHPTRGEIWLECHAVPSCEEEDAIHWFGFVHEISESKRTEESLRVSQARLLEALRAGGMGVWVWDVPRDDVWMDDALLQLVGKARDTLPRTSEGILALVHQDDRESVRAALRTLAEKPNELTFEHRVIDANGSVRYLAVRGRSEGDGPDRVQRATALNIDVTTQKHATDAFLRSQKLEALGTLAGGIAHDFNNILQAISGNAALALRALPKDHGARHFLNEVADASARASELVRRILTFGRPGEQRLERLSLGPVVEDALKLMRATLPAQIEIAHDCGAELHVLADATQIHQIVVNLTTNAAQAIGAAGGTISVSLACASEGAFDGAEPLAPGAYAQLEVRDNGAGIPRETMSRIFDPFFTTKPVGQGTGLGLSVVHGLVKSLGGAVTVESQVARGTTFRLFLPLAETPEGAEKPPDPPAPASGQRVMFVDDEEVLVMLGTHILEALGYSAVGHHRPRDALAAFLAEPASFDAVVTDVSMPGLSGFELVKRMREVREDVPVVMMSGFVGPEETEGAAKIGVPDLLLKPVSIEQLGTALARALARGKSEA